MVAVAGTRLALLELDIDESLARLVVVFSYWMAALFAFGLAAIMALCAILLSVNAEHRIAVLLCAAIALLILGSASMTVALQRARRSPRWFDATLEELEKDAAILRGLRS